MSEVTGSRRVIAEWGLYRLVGWEDDIQGECVTNIHTVIERRTTNAMNETTWVLLHKDLVDEFFMDELWTALYYGDNSFQWYKKI